VLYPIYIHKDANSAYGAAFPDFPGCFAGADDLQDLPAAAQEAVEVHFHGETEPIPRPSAPEDWSDDAQFQGGYWMLVEIDLSRVNAKAIRLNVSLPQSLVKRIDAVAQARSMSRSAFLALAAEHEMQVASR